MRDALVLCYHGVSEEWPSDLAIQPGQLDEQISFYLEHGYRPVTFTEAVTGRASEHVISVTFDDAYRSVLELGLPVLAGLGVPATVFAPTSFVGSSSPLGWDGTAHWASSDWSSEIQTMSWEDLAELAANGWEVGSHTRSHPHLTELSDEQLDDELRGSREDLEEALGVPCTSIAYPYGDCDSRVGLAAARAGYRAGGGLLPARLRANRPLLFPRVFSGRYNREAAIRRRARPAVRRLQASGAWPWVGRIIALKKLSPPGRHVE